MANLYTEPTEIAIIYISSILLRVVVIFKALTLDQDSVVALSDNGKA